MNINDSEWTPPKTPRAWLNQLSREVDKGDAYNLRRALLLHLSQHPASHIVPHELRGSAYAVLLPSIAHTTSSAASADAHHDPSSSRPHGGGAAAKAPSALLTSDENVHMRVGSKTYEQILVDAARTRPSLQRFKSDGPARAVLVRILTAFCTQNHAEYLQGMNEILAPLLMLEDTRHSLGTTYLLFENFVKTFTPVLLAASEIALSERVDYAFTMFDALVMYHAPQLHWFLADNLVSSHFYAVSWFLTAFSRNLSINLLYALWDILIVRGADVDLFFFSLALVLHHAPTIHHTPNAELPQFMSHLAPTSTQQVFDLYLLGAELKATTPPSFVELIGKSWRLEPVDAQGRGLAGRQGKQTAPMTVTSAELAPRGGMRYVFVDCRAEEEVAAGRVAMAVRAPLEDIRARVRAEKPGHASIANPRVYFEKALGFIKPFHDANHHICLFGTGDPKADAMDVQPFAQYLTKSGFSQISIMAGGFEEIVRRFRDNESILIDFDESKYFELSGRRRLGIDPSALLNLREKLSVQVAIIRSRADDAMSRAMRGMEDGKSQHVPFLYRKMASPRKEEKLGLNGAVSQKVADPAKHKKASSHANFELNGEGDCPEKQVMKTSKSVASKGNYSTGFFRIFSSKSIGRPDAGLKNDETKSLSRLPSAQSELMVSLSGDISEEPGLLRERSLSLNPEEAETVEMNELTPLPRQGSKTPVPTSAAPPEIVHMSELTPLHHKSSATPTGDKMASTIPMSQLTPLGSRQQSAGAPDKSAELFGWSRQSSAAHNVESDDLSAGSDSASISEDLPSSLETDDESSTDSFNNRDS